MEELQVIEEAQKGSRWALNKLLADNYNKIIGYMVKMTFDATLAQDITQEAMLKAILNIKKFKPEAKFSTYLITIATNIYKDYLRKNSKLQPLDENIEPTPENVEDIAINRMKYEEVIKILSGLPYEKRAVFVLKHYYGYKYEEISKILGCPVGTVRSRLHYCVEYIKKEFERRAL